MSGLLPEDCVIEVEAPDGPAVMTGSFLASVLCATRAAPLGNVAYAGPVTEIPGGTGAMIGKGARFGIDCLQPGLASLGIEDLRREMTGIGARLPRVLALPSSRGAVWEFPFVDRVWWFWFQPLPEREG